MIGKSKIFVIYHTDKEIVNNDVYTPIVVGNHKDDFPSDFLRDDVGENIADLNSRYNELTAIYWVYKHIDEFKDLEYVGFSHYRRFLCFGGLDKTAYVTRHIEKDLIASSSEQIEELFKDYDFIAPRPSHYKSVQKHYERSHNRVDLGILLSVFDEVAPEYSDVAREYYQSKDEYLYNMFVFKKEEFIKYAEFLFKVVDQFFKENGGVNRLYVSERITGIYIYNMLKSGQKAKLLPVLHVRRKLIVPAFREVRKNFKKKMDRGLFFKLKPLILCFMPRHVEQFFRRRKAK